MGSILGRVLGAIVRLEAGEDPPAPKGSFVEAIAWHRARDVSLTPEAFDELDDALGRRAFTVAGLAQLDLVMDVHRAIDRAVHDGTTLDDFKKQVSEELEREWGATGERHASLENIFRTNVQAAYDAGRYQQAKEVADYRPFWQFDAIEDARTSPWCRPLGGVVRRFDDPWWRTHVPPLHFQCRSSIRTLTAAQAHALGLTADENLPRDEEGKLVEAQPGFGAAPETPEALAEQIAEVAKERVADTWARSPGLARVAEEKLAAGAGASENPSMSPAAGGGSMGTPPPKPPAPGGGDGGDEHPARKRLNIPPHVPIRHDRSLTKARHTAQGAEVLAALAAGDEAHHFLDTVNLDALEADLWARGAVHDEIRGYRGVTLRLEQPIGVRKQAGRPDVPLYVAQAKGKLIKGAWVYHLVPRTRPPRK